MTRAVTGRAAGFATGLALAALALALLAVPPARAQATAPHAVAQPVVVPGADGVDLPGWWYPAAGPESASRGGAMVLLHGCGGVALDPQGRPGRRYRDMAAMLNAAGVSALLVDSFTPRGAASLCTQAQAERRVRMRERRVDALAALAWLAARPQVDPARVGLLGWSNGGSTVLAATNRGHREVSRAAVRPRLAVAFYPGCEAELQRGWQAVAPLLLLLGGADDWTAPGPCTALAAAAAAGPGPAPEVAVYPGAFHGFDGHGPVRLRRDVPDGVRPGEGVHVGGDAHARAAAQARLAEFLGRHWPR